MKNAMDMSEEEYQAAVKRKAWLDPPAAKSPVPAPVAPKKSALDMTDEEFEHAMKTQAWRQAIPTR